MFLDANLHEKERRQRTLKKTEKTLEEKEDTVYCRSKNDFIYLISISSTFLYTQRSFRHITERYSVIYNRTNCQHYIRKVLTVGKVKHSNLTDQS